jgi:KaiC/GvpD/RAD55 family RecA-like ATPase
VDLIVQAKHYAGSTAKALLRAARAEDAKVAVLKPTRYILVTSQSLTPHQKDALIAAMPSAPLAKGDVLGKEDLNNLLSRHPEVLRSHFKLWLTDVHTLERIVHSGVYNRTDAELDIIKRVVPRFVHNDSVAKAEAVLERRGALIIAGDPGVGKTTLARALTWLHLEQGWKVFVVDDLKEAMAVCTPGEKRLIVLDDFLGQISLSNTTVRDVDQRLPTFLDRVRYNKDIRFILTTRGYLLRQAQLESTRLESADLKAAEVVIHVGDYTRRIRAAIVFNHIYFSGLTLEEKEALLRDHFYLNMVDHRNFSPRLIDLLTSPDYQGHQTTPIREVVARVLENPVELWATPYRSHFSEDSRRVMLVLFFSAFIPNTDDVIRTFSRLVSRAEHRAHVEPLIGRFRQAVKPLDGSVVSSFGAEIDFSNPGVRDFVSAVIIEDRLLSSLLGAMESFEEIGEAFKFYVRNVDALDMTAPKASEWVDALRRTLRSGVMGRVMAIDLGLEMGRFFGEDAGSTLEFVEEILQSLSVDEHDASGEVFYRSALNHYGELTRDRQLLVPSIGTLVDQLTNMLFESGHELSLDEISAINKAIRESGEGSLNLYDATREALRVYLGELQSKLDDISSPDELDDREADLRNILNGYGLRLEPEHERVLDIRRAMVEDESNSSSSYYPTTSKSEAGQDVTDDEVKSLFGTLLAKVEQ